MTAASPEELEPTCPKSLKLMAPKFDGLSMECHLLRALDRVLIHDRCPGGVTAQLRMLSGNADFPADAVSAAGVF